MLIVQVVDTVFPIYGLPETAIRTIVTVLGIGLLPVPMLAWAFELTPDGLKRDRHVDRTGSAGGKSGKCLDRVIMILLTLALAYFASARCVLVPEMTAEQVEAARQLGTGEALVDSYRRHHGHVGNIDPVRDGNRTSGPEPDVRWTLARPEFPIFFPQVIIPAI